LVSWLGFLLSLVFFSFPPLQIWVVRLRCVGLSSFYQGPLPVFSE
jgi:hypothetical protein